MYHHLACVLSHFGPTPCNPMDCSPWDPLSIGVSRKEYWSGLPCHPPGHLPDRRMEPMSLTSLALQGVFFTTSTTWKVPSLPWYPAKISEKDVWYLDPQTACGENMWGGVVASCRQPAPTCPHVRHLRNKSSELNQTSRGLQSSPTSLKSSTWDP